MAKTINPGVQGAKEKVLDEAEAHRYAVGREDLNEIVEQRVIS